MKQQPIAVYTPNSLYQKGILTIFGEMVASLFNNRELIWQIFLRNFKARYRQSLLGWLWIFLLPIITMGTFLLLNMSGVIRIGEIPVPYPIYGLLGFSLWQLFANGLVALTDCVISVGSLVSQINFPKHVLIFAAIGQAIIDFLVRLLLVLLVFAFYKIVPPVWILVFPLFILPILFLTAGLGFLTSLFNVVVRDTRDFINLGLNFFLFLMPIMYAMPEKGILEVVNKFNPIYFLMSTPREIIISSNINFPKEYFLSSGIAIIIFLIGWFSFYVSESKLAERL